MDVLEKAGFCKLCEYEKVDDKIILKPLQHKSSLIYGYPGKKSGLEVQDLKNIQINEPYENHFRILMLHTTITEAKGTLPIDSVSLSEVPKADYYALGHIHIDFEIDFEGSPAIYSGPTFPNNFHELEELKHGSFYIIDVEGFTKITKKEIKLKEVVLIDLEIENALTGTQTIISELKKRNLSDSIVLLKIHGELIQGKPSDIKFAEIQQYLETQNIYSFLKNTSKFGIKSQELQVHLESNEMEKVEEVLVKKYEKENPSNFNEKIFSLMDALGLEKQEGEKNEIFESRLFSELNKIFEIEL